MASHCARCKRRSVVAFRVPEEMERLVAWCCLGRRKSGVCITCFDELVEQAGVALTFEDVLSISWSGGRRHGGHDNADNRPLGGLTAAIAGRQPPLGCIHHCDRGAQYAAKDFRGDARPVD